MQFFSLISATHSNFFPVLRPQRVPHLSVDFKLFSHHNTSTVYLPLKLSLGNRNINILHGGSFVWPDPVLWKSYDQQEMKTTRDPFVLIDFSDILKTEHLSQTKSWASFWPKSEMRNFMRNIKNSIVSGYSWMKSSDENWQPFTSYKHALFLANLSAHKKRLCTSSCLIQDAEAFHGHQYECVPRNPAQDPCSETRARSVGLPLPQYAFLLMWWLAFLINGYRKCRALHGIPSSFCFPEACLWKKPAPEAKQRRSLKIPIFYPSSCS